MQDMHDLSPNHWTTEGYTERMIKARWGQILLHGFDKIIFHGTCRQLVAKKLGAGIVEIGKKPLKEMK